MRKILVSTTNDIPGRTIRDYRGMVKGLIVRSPTIGQGIMGGLKNIVGGHNRSYTSMCEQGRDDAYQLMLQHAEEMGANAIIGMRYDASEFQTNQGGFTEVLCYGTAVIID